LAETAVAHTHAYDRDVDAVAVVVASDLSAFTGLIEVGVALAVAVVSGLWAVTKWMEERRRTREQEERLARERLEHERTEEKHRREDKAADLVLALGSADDERSRLWTASALALYPDETLPLLVNAFAHASRETATAIRLALTSIGPRALPQLCKMNRVATTIVHASSVPEAETVDADTADVDAARELLRCTRATIAYLILQADRGELEAVDFEDVDLSAMNFARADLRGVRFRKAILEGAVLARAKLGQSNFRGARVDGAVFTRAAAPGADFTGMQGRIRAIRLHAPGAVFQDVKLSDSEFDAADLGDSYFRRARMERIKIPGGNLSGCKIENCDLSGLLAPSARLVRTRLRRVRLGKAVLRSARVGEAQLDGCRLMRVDAREALAENALFTDCDLGGADLTQAKLKGGAFVRCNLGGARFERADLQGCRFERCKLLSTSFAGARLRGAIFADGNIADAAKLDLEGADWEEADFAGDATLEATFRAWREVRTDADG